MAVATDNAGHFVAEYERFELERASAEESWFAPVRSAAVAHFAERGLPTTREEEWRYTNVNPIAGIPFRLGDTIAPELTVNTIKPFLFAEEDWPRLVFINGRHSPELSFRGNAPDELRMASLADALRSDPDALRPHLARYAAPAYNAFVALNTAFLEDGAFIYVPRGRVLLTPLHVVYISTLQEQPLMTHPRTLIVAEPGSQVSVVESYVTLDGVQYLTNAVTELVAGENAVVDHYRLQREDDEAFHISTLRIEQQRNSTVSSHCATLDGALTRNNVHAVMSGEGGDLDLSGLYMLRGSQHVDNHLRVEHAAPHCNSREYYKGILMDAAHGVFTGRIVVHKDAQKTDAKQTNMNLLLSGDAQVDTKPQLEIFADDVKCTHGATIGQIDREALFYLRARGIDEATARSLLIYAFASESIGRIKVKALRDVLEALLFAESPEDRLLREAV
jgi:Fe-S cluster assembly protein SufD